MRITDVRATQPATPGSPPDWRTQLGQIVVEVETADGLVGTGVGGGGLAGVHVVETVLRDRLLARDASDVETLHLDLLEHTTFYGRKGLVVMAISGVDLALWDLRGKAAGRSMVDILSNDISLDPGAPFDPSRRLPTYSTVWDEEHLRDAMRAGNSAYKLHVERFREPSDVAGLKDFVERARSIVGVEAPLMLDAFARWNVETTLRVADAIGELGVEWIEEPLAPDDLRGYEELARSCPIPIAGGEHEYTTRGFRELVERGLHAVLQPDVNWCGGMTTLVDVYLMAKEAGLRVCPHRGSEPYALPAIAALDPTPLAESPRPWFDVLEGAPRIENGTIAVSGAPGFGVSLRTA